MRSQAGGLWVRKGVIKGSAVMHSGKSNEKENERPLHENSFTLRRFVTTKNIVWAGIGKKKKPKWTNIDETFFCARCSNEVGKKENRKTRIENWKDSAKTVRRRKSHRLVVSLDRLTSVPPPPPGQGEQHRKKLQRIKRWRNSVTFSIPVPILGRDTNLWAKRPSGPIKRK